MNNFITLQNRVRDLLKASPIFSGVTVTTEEKASIDSKLEEDLIKATGFGLIVKSAGGDTQETSKVELLLHDMIAVTIIHNPTVDQDHSAFDALQAAIELLHGKPASLEEVSSLRTRSDFLTVRGWDFRPDAPAGFVIYQLLLVAPNRFQAAHSRNPQA